MTKSRYLCPVCKQPLTLRRYVYNVDRVLYCAFGPCAEQLGGEAANEGADGLTEEEAYRNLVQSIEKEQEAA